MPDNAQWHVPEALIAGLDARGLFDASLFRISAVITSLTQLQLRKSVALSPPSRQFSLSSQSSERVPTLCRKAFLRPFFVMIAHIAFCLCQLMSKAVTNGPSTRRVPSKTVHDSPRVVLHTRWDAEVSPTVLALRAFSSLLA
jgi:hypothetical protein